MKKIYTLFLLAFLSCFTDVNAQVWAPNIGTYWYFDAPQSPHACHGYVKYDYYKDSLINGNNCQIIRRYTERRCFISNTPSNTARYLIPIFTYTNSNQVVYVSDSGDGLNSNPLSVQPQVFDTLFWFNAPIGAKWRMIHQNNNCTSSVPCIVTVQDTGHNSVQGLNLRWQKVNYMAKNSSSNIQSITDTIYERFGYLNTDPFNPENFCATTLHAQTYRVFRCYGDNQITNLKYKYTGACDYYYTSIDERSKADDLSVFPNPAGSFLALNSISNAWQDATVEMQDALGRTVLKEPFRKRFDISFLLPGVYFVTVKNSAGLRSFKIVKE